MKIFRHQKVWEIRNKQCTKRGRVGIACTAKSSPTGKALLLAEVTIADCIEVARNVQGFVTAPDIVNNYMFLDRNKPKHQVNSLKEFPALKEYKKVYAWVLADPQEYTTPKKLAAKRGCVVWVNLGKA